MRITVSVPGLLRDCIGGWPSVTISAATLDEALWRLRKEYPLLRVHMYDEHEQLRQHVLVFFNADNIAWLERLDVPLQPDDRITVLQAVSGG
jgi:adenylyltransferase/sulfurtransferase